MSIIFPDHYGSYYFPNASDVHNFFNQDPPTTHPAPPTLPINPEQERMERLEFIYKDHELIPKATTSKVGSNITIQKVDSHPITRFQGKQWCVIQYEHPPELLTEEGYEGFLDKVLLEKMDAIVIEPFVLGQKVEQWLNILEIIHAAMGALMSITVVASLHTSMTDDRALYMGIGSLMALELYRKWIYGDPMTYYRNFDFSKDSDMDFLFHMSELLNVHSRFSHVIMRDNRRATFRLKSYRAMIAIQMGFVSYKFLFASFLRYYFPGRPI